MFIKKIKDLYYDNNLKSGKNKKILFSIHKDRVGFFVVKKLGQNEYILFIYGNILKEDIKNIKKLSSKNIEETNIIIKEFIKKRYLKIYSEKNLIIGDFMQYIPNYYEDNNNFYGPYFDNLISAYLFKNFFYDFQVFQSIDEESKLINTRFKFGETNIILDTIWQDYIKEKIDFNKIYNITKTNFRSGFYLNHEKIVNQTLDLSFKTEFDFFPKNTYFLLCPIEKGHSQNSKINKNSIENFKEIIEFIINKTHE